MLNRLKYISIFIIVLFIIACGRFFVPPHDEPVYMIEPKVFPNIGTTSTEFSFSVSNLIVNGDTITDFTGYKTRWDLNNDNIYDTDWEDSAGGMISFKELGKQEVSFVLKSPDGDNFIAPAQNIWVQELFKLIDTPNSGVPGNMDWSRDGTNRFAFDAPSNDPVAGQSCNCAIWIADYPSGAQQQVSQNCAYFPEWSPDGKYILFKRDNSFWVVEMATGVEIEIFSPEDNLSFVPRWSPSGNKLAFIAHNAIKFYHFGSNRITKMKTAKQYSLLCWSPDGNTIAAGSSGGSTAPQVDIIDEEEEKIYYNVYPKFVGSKLDWSPNGRWLSTGLSAENNVLNIIDLNTGRIIAAKFDGLDGLWYPGWSPDGKLITFEANAQGEQKTLWALTFPEDI